MQIQHRKIGYDQPPVVIAEIGINHGGSLEVAKKMVDVAHASGVEIIKHQTHIVDDEMSSLAKNIKPGNSDKSIYEIMQSCSLNEIEEIELKQYIESKGIIFLSTPFSRAAADRLEKMNVSAYKIGSGECNNYPLIEHIAKFKKPVILSTGMNNIESIQVSVDILKDYGVDFALLHTTNLYPTPPSLVRFGGMIELMNKFPGVVVGLSDHTLSNLACFGATALGACILERHFTDSMYRKGPDIANSMDGLALKELILGANEIYLMRGGQKEAAKEEDVTINFAFATVVAIRDIEKGDVLSSQNIWVKRPGVGEIKAKDYKNIIGKVAKKNIKADTHISWSDISL